MQLDREQATAILALLEGMSLRQIRAAGALSALAVLERVSTAGIVEVYILVAADGCDKVSGIKTIREHTGLGLKEAKDLFDTMFVDASPMPNGLVKLGPIKRIPAEDAAAVQSAASRKLDQVPIWISIGQM